MKNGATASQPDHDEAARQLGDELRPDVSLYNTACWWWPRAAAPEAVWIRDFIHQTQWELAEADWHTARAALALLADFGYARLPVRNTPFFDEHLDLNQLALEAGLASLTGPDGRKPVFSVQLENGIGGDDGRISADIDLEFIPFDEGEPFWAPVQDVPVEVGQTSAKTTVKRLIDHSALARWPYGSKTLIVVARRPGSEPLNPLMAALRKFEREGGAK